MFKWMFRCSNMGRHFQVKSVEPIPHTRANIHLINREVQASKYLTCSNGCLGVLVWLDISKIRVLNHKLKIKENRKGKD
ncbi:hypothetical protein HanRHA438_Chr14g0654911 [Helianthus annuus]|nr:hypothetical protein HanIR_Chr14g0698731 [Helianthus annuus]KAJ0853762.1 hypothetical protein HanRHA438_Chr14g0654911 [Helianthus annuus]